MPAETIACRVRWMIRRDLTEVVLIERDGFQDAWTEEEIVRFLRGRSNVGMAAVAGAGERIAGFVLYELRHDRFVIHRLAVEPLYREAGVGRAIVEKMAGKLSGRRPRLEIVVRERNLGGQLFLRTCGLRAERVLRGCWLDTGEDGFLMALTVDD